MTRNTITILNDREYDLRTWLLNNDSFLQRLNLSNDIYEKIIEKNTTQAEIFFIVVDNCNFLHAFTNPVINAIKALPAAQACQKLKENELFNKEEHGKIVLEHSNPEDLNRAINLLAENGILVSETFNIVAKKKHPYYSANMLRIMKNFGINSECMRDSYVSLEYFKNELAKKLSQSSIGDGVLIPFISILSFLNATNIHDSESIDLIIEKLNIDLPNEDILKNLKESMCCLRKIDYLSYESFKYLIDNIYSQSLHNILQKLTKPSHNDNPKLLTSANFLLLKNTGVNLDELYRGIYCLDLRSHLNQSNFEDIVTSKEPFALAKIIDNFSTYRSVHEIVLDKKSETYYAIKHIPNIIALEYVLNMMLTKSIFTLEHIKNLIKYSNVLFVENEGIGFWDEIKYISPELLDAIFRKCQAIIEVDGLTDRDAQIAQIKITIDRYRQPDSHTERFFKNNRISRNDKILENVQQIVNENFTKINKQKLMIAFHTDKNQTLHSAFESLSIPQNSFSSKQKQFLTDEVLNSADIFKTISADMLDFAKSIKKDFDDLKDLAPQDNGYMII